MTEFPLSISPEAERAHEERLDDLEIRLLECVDGLLEETQPEALRDFLYGVAFDRNEALPKRANRPKVENALLVEQLYRAHDPGGTALEALLEFTVAVTEYFDIADDVFDGDVAAGRESEGFLAMQLLLPLYVRRLHRLGDDAVSFWTERAMALIEAPYVERAADPSFERYLQTLEGQSHLFGFVTGLAAIAADATPEAIQRAERIGRSYYTYEQLLVDRRQFERDDPDAWNAWQLATEESVLELLRDFRSEATALLEALPDERRRALSPLFAHDLDAVASGEP